jgi:hypothetical protein
MTWCLTALTWSCQAGVCVCVCEGGPWRREGEGWGEGWGAPDGAVAQPEAPAHVSIALMDCKDRQMRERHTSKPGLGRGGCFGESQLKPAFVRKTGIVAGAGGRNSVRKFGRVMMGSGACRRPCVGWRYPFLSLKIRGDSLFPCLVLPVSRISHAALLVVQG